MVESLSLIISLPLCMERYLTQIVLCIVSRQESCVPCTQKLINSCIPLNKLNSINEWLISGHMGTYPGRHIRPVWDEKLWTYEKWVKWGDNTCMYVAGHKKVNPGPVAGNRLYLRFLIKWIRWRKGEGRVKEGSSEGSPP